MQRELAFIERDLKLLKLELEEEENKPEEEYDASYAQGLRNRIAVKYREMMSLTSTLQ